MSMNGSPNQRRNNNQRRRRPAGQPATADFWHGVAELPDVRPITVTPDPSALMRSLGDLPLNDSGDVRYHIAAVIERAASIATALALTAGLLEDGQLP